MCDPAKPKAIYYNKEEAQLRYFSAMFTQLVLNGLSVQAAKAKTDEAVEVIIKLNLKFPEITIG